MNQFAPILPEVIVTLGAIVLMMVAAFAGRRSSGLRQLGGRRHPDRRNGRTGWSTV